MVNEPSVFEPLKFYCIYCEFYLLDFKKRKVKTLTVLCIVVVVLLFYVHGKHQWSCRDGQLA